jgi:hypothetical protein
VLALDLFPCNPQCSNLLKSDVRAAPQRGKVI